MGIMVVLPEVIPSLVRVQQIIILVFYLANIAFAYVIIVRFWNYLKQSFEKRTSIIVTTLVAIIITGSLFFSFLFTSLGIGQGFMGGTLAKELDYPTRKVKLYIYNDGFLDPLTTIKMKHKTWPIMEDVAFIENCHPLELKILKNDNTVKISCNNIVVKVDLINGKTKITYLNLNANE